MRLQSPETARPRAPRVARDVRIEQILDAAISAFSQAGYREVSTASIAAALGLSEPALFRHFPTKRELYLAALDRSADALMQPLRTIAERARSPLLALLEIGQWHFSEIEADSRHLRLRFRSSTETGDPDVAQRVRTHFVAVFELLHGLYEAARAAGEIATETDTRAHTWLLMAIGMLLDTTQLIGLRAALPLQDIPQLMLLATPRPSTAGA